MAPRSRPKTDPFEGELERTFNPGAFIPYRACSSFVGDLEEVEGRIAALAGSDPARAVVLYETFLAGCYEKATELDDSSGSFGTFVEKLFCGWVKARQNAGADPEDTSARLLGWMTTDPHGYCGRLEEELAKAFNKAGLAAFSQGVKDRVEAAAGVTQEGETHLQRRWGQALRNLYLAGKRLEDYIALAEGSGLTEKDCRAIATLLVARRKPAEALVWVERGLELYRKGSGQGSEGHRLDGLRRELLMKVGRREEAIQSAWDYFRRFPHRSTYLELLACVPKVEAKAWRERALGVIDQASLNTRLELLLALREGGRLAQVVRVTPDAALEDLSHTLTEPAAICLQKPHPDLGGRLWLAQAMRIVKGKRSRYYDEAVIAFGKARLCFQRAGLAQVWDGTVAEVRAEHRRKLGFIADFERLVAGDEPVAKPTFLERAKANWQKGTPT